MDENPVVGYRFHPTDEELINHYLKNKILGKPWLIDEAITEINISTHDPDSFPSLSKIKSNDSTYYFFAPTELISRKKNSPKKPARKRSTRSGYWKSTGTDREIKDKSGEKIGEKKTLVYHLGKHPNGVRTPWVMHEYLIKRWSHLNPESYVICKIKYKGEIRDIPSSSGPSQSLIINTPPEVVVDEESGLSLNDLAIPMNEPENDPNSLLLNPNLVQDGGEFLDGFGPNTNVEQPQQSPYLAQEGDDYWSRLQDYEDCFPDLDLILQENRNDHKPRQPLSGTIVDYNSDSDNDAESISATSYQGSSSSGDLQTYSADSSVNQKNPESQLPLKQEVKEELVKTDTKDLLTIEKTHKNLMKMILGFIVLVAISRKNTESQLTKQEVKQDNSETFITKTEKKRLFITEEEAMKNTHKNTKYIYLMKMIIGLIFLLLLVFIGNIVSVLSTVKP